MDTDTGRFRHLPDNEAPKSMEIPFRYGETVEVKGHPFKVRSINATTHEITLRSARYHPSPMQEETEKIVMLGEIEAVEQKMLKELQKGQGDQP